MIRGFEFEEDGRTYVCRVESRRATPDEGWWWFDVSGDRQRYAPFQAVSADTKNGVKARIVAFYANLLEARARPVEPRSHWSRRPKAAAAPAEPSAAP
ncbi:MAG TPA: hypothetical protein VGP25_20025 [Gemmatimonadaceae bacterium]|jgi:hypothetical protein|nr:hypothetical protein [Gemmatimonadaceae bacterium]